MDRREEAMPSRLQRGGAGKGDRSASMFLGSWSRSHRVHSTLGMGARWKHPSMWRIHLVASEWQDFVGRRLKEDVTLPQRLARSTTPDQILAAYTDFWRKAGRTTEKEITTMTKQMTDRTSKVV